MPAITSATKGSVLLVEEYDALAVAIESALRKFAPHHSTYVARSLAEARTLAHAHKPELIILDFDPPHPGAIGFLEELQSVLPESRVLVIAAGVSSELIGERGANGALQFLEKPFELVDFGAAVQALLGPWMETGTSRGTLRDLALMDAASLLCLAGANAMLQVHASTNHNGQLHLHKGHLVHAVTDNAEGERALIDMLCWKNVRFIEVAAPQGIPKTLRGPWAATLLEALRAAKKRAVDVRETLAPKSIVRSPAPAPEKTGPKILVIDDTEMLLIFVEDSLSLADPNLQITTAMTGLHGLKEATRIKPDLILVDYVLPDIKGDEVCRRIAADDATHHIPIIMMSGHVPEMTAVAEKLPNVVATIAKPFLSDAMVALVRQTLREGPPNVASVSAAQKKSPDALSGKENAPKLKSSPSNGGLKGETARQSPSRLSAEPAAAHLAVPPFVPLASAPGMPEMMRPQISTALRQVPPPVSLPVTPSAPGPARNEVLLDLPLDVVSMQFDSSFQIGAIRARPASPMVAIEIPALAARTSLPLLTSFRLGPVDLDTQGHISIVRLIPTAQPFRLVTTGSAFEIGGVTVVPANHRERLQLLSTAVPNMTMQLFAPLELESVEFSATLDVRQLVLRCRGKSVRVTLNSQSSSTRSGASFETTAVMLDEAKRIRELTLAPVS